MNNIEKNRRSFWLVVFALIFAVGFAVGGAVQKGERINATITDYTLNAVESRLSGDAASVFLDSLLAYSVSVVIVCFLGINKSGTLLNVIFVFFLGLGKGALASNLACDSGIRGLGFFALVFLPGMTAATCALLLSASLSAVLCFEKEKIKHGRKRISALFIYIFITAFSAGLDAVFSVMYKALA